MGGNDDIMELIWHNGQVVMHNQNPRSNKKPAAGVSVQTAATGEEDTGPSNNVFMQKDEMASWLHYPVEDSPLDNYLYGNDLMYPPPPAITITSVAPNSIPPTVMIPPRPPVSTYRRVEVEFTRPRSPELGPSSSSPALLSAKPQESRASRVSDKPAPISGIGARRETETCDMSVMSSPGSGGSGASAGLEPVSERPPPATDDRKRKGVDTDDNECHIEDVEFEYADGKKQSHVGSTSTKRTRAAEVHNLTERRRRDRINEKMKALQELIPRCNKSDKASMLDEAIEYLKSLQMQVQMMSMGCNMVPMMFPGVQQYVPPMAMGMGMGMGMNGAMVPHPAILPSSLPPNPAAAAAHLGQRFPVPVPGFNMPPVNIAGPAPSQAANMTDPMMNPLTLNSQSQNHPRVPSFADPFQHYIGLHPTQLPLPQNQGGVPPVGTKPSSCKDATSTNHHQTG
ncbi:transcription factor PIF1-like [Bidens hawaiensis]|uniref:transcription factor PIF1-like n=1 Tax=Bidens hawaiensis TaxID=980011 RepID=UPI00404B48C1